MDNETLFKAAMFELITASAALSAIDERINPQFATEAHNLKVVAAFRSMSAATGNVADIIERMIGDEKNEHCATK